MALLEIGHLIGLHAIQGGGKVEDVGIHGADNSLDLARLTREGESDLRHSGVDRLENAVCRLEVHLVPRCAALTDDYSDLVSATRCNHYAVTGVHDPVDLYDHAQPLRLSGCG